MGNAEYMGHNVKQSKIQGRTKVHCLVYHTQTSAFGLSPSPPTKRQSINKMAAANFALEPEMVRVLKKDDTYSDCRWHADDVSRRCGPGQARVHCRSEPRRRD